MVIGSVINYYITKHLKSKVLRLSKCPAFPSRTLVQSRDWCMFVYTCVYYACLYTFPHKMTFTFLKMSFVIFSVEDYTQEKSLSSQRGQKIIIVISLNYIEYSHYQQTFEPLSCQAIELCRKICSFLFSYIINTYQLITFIQNCF